ncbi:MAG: TetR/AcrR family transcriptional regulator [Actinomycetota bacterium]|nr:TetR/AcrR family transcriptional regulator [Actinomycetota bacterium]
MAGSQKTWAETRELITAAAATLVTEGGPEAVSVAAVMRRAGVSRTAFYRQFDSIYDVYADLIVRTSSTLLAESGAWISEPEAVGSPGVAYPNILGFARVFSASAAFLTALHDACVCDSRLRQLWRDSLVQPFVDASTAAISRDQAAGVVASNIDPAATAEALTLLGERLAIELLGRRGAEPEEYAAVIAPIWISVLFGEVPGDRDT